MQDLGINQLGPYPILQGAGAVVVLMGLALAVYSGTRDRKLSADQQEVPGRVRWYFDGPLNAALETLRDIYRVMSSIDNQVETFGEQFRTHTRLLEEIKQKLVEIKDVQIATLEILRSDHGTKGRR
jgi:hypothetical protein